MLSAEEKHQLLSPATLPAQELYQLRLHIVILISDIEANDSLSIQMGLKLFGKLVSMAFFHHKYHRSPLDLLNRYRHIGIITKPAE